MNVLEKKAYKVDTLKTFFSCFENNWPDICCIRNVQIERTEPRSLIIENPTRA